MDAEDIGRPATIVMRDNDTNFTRQFDAVFEDCGAKIKRNTPLSRNLPAHVERFIEMMKVECLDKVVIVAQRHLNYVCREFAIHYNRERPHEARDHLPPSCKSPPEPMETISQRDVVCTTRLGELLRSYSRWAA